MSSPLGGGECVGEGAGWVDHHRRETADFGDCDQAQPPWPRSIRVRRARRAQQRPGTNAPPAPVTPSDTTGPTFATRLDTPREPREHIFERRMRSRNILGYNIIQHGPTNYRRADSPATQRNATVQSDFVTGHVDWWCRRHIDQDSRRQVSQIGLTRRTAKRYGITGNLVDPLRHNMIQGRHPSGYCEPFGRIGGCPHRCCDRSTTTLAPMAYCRTRERHQRLTQPRRVRS